MHSTASFEFTLQFEPPIPAYLIWRDGAPCSVPINDLRPNDLVWATDSWWHPAYTFPQFSGMFGNRAASSPPQAEHLFVTFGKVLLASAVVVGVGVLAFKAVQAATDEEFGTTEFPANFRKEKIRRHVVRHGRRCLRCRRRAKKSQLSVDHVVSLANGGLTSSANSEVMCLPCNSSKGARNTPWDYVRGRAA